MRLPSANAVVTGVGNDSVRQRSLTEFILSQREGFEMTDSYVVVITSPSAKLRINSARNLSLRQIHKMLKLHHYPGFENLTFCS